MKKSLGQLTKIILFFLLLIVSCQNSKKETKKMAVKTISNYKTLELTTFDSTLVAPFFNQYPELKKFQNEVVTLYQKQHYNYIWFDQKGIKEVGYLFYNKLNNLTSEGINAKIPYQNQLDTIFQEETTKQEPEVNSELLLSCMYFFYTEKVYTGLPIEKSNQLGWYLPRKKQSYINYLDSILAKPSLMDKDEREILGQYYRLREVLKKYRALEKEPWNPIQLDSAVSQLKVGDSAEAIAEIRNRLYLLGDLDSDSKSTLYDTNLTKGILNYKKRNGLGINTSISKSILNHLNIPIANRIKTIIVNMERCRWFSSPLSTSKTFIFINIPAYQLRYFENGKPVLQSKVVVGKAMNKTAVFSADMKYIVFSPYWNVPKNILYKEVLPAIEKNPNYLYENDMEWFEGGIRQRPGPKNALGVVKFMFPNSNSIYLHDTPSKSLFNQEKRAFSHGCIRLEKPKELAHLILKNDPNWTFEKIETAMHSGVEKWYALPKKIPVYIGYFTAWVTKDGVAHFYEDVYQRDERLAAMLLEE
jgi:murein L,D-transpeptidase YcbB/YkuD